MLLLCQLKAHTIVYVRYLTVDTRCIDNNLRLNLLYNNLHYTVKNFRSSAEKIFVKFPYLIVASLTEKTAYLTEKQQPSPLLYGKSVEKWKISAEKRNTAAHVFRSVIDDTADACNGSQNKNKST